MNRGLVSVRLLAWAAIGLFAVGGGVMVAQGQPPVPQLPDPINVNKDPFLHPFLWRPIGPAVMGGRIDDIAVVEQDPSTIYLGYATGGVWKTTNNGTTWLPIFDEQPYTSIGDIEVFQADPNIIYVGTGEPNNRQSSSFGGGMFKSTDAGRSFIHIGLKETQSIGRIVIHPADPNTVYVAAVGHLFGPNPDRGLYKTVDGGKTWTNTKFIDNDTGFIDVVMHPTRHDTLFAASYQRRRQPWGFNGGGPGSGIWRTDDAGRTWSRLSGKGLPTSQMLGRIGLSISRSKPDVIYAQMEVGPSGGTGAGVNADGSLAQPGQRRGDGGSGSEEPKRDPTKSGVWRSDDGGHSWKFQSNNNNRPMYYSKIRVDPGNHLTVYTTGASAYKSLDGGKTFETMRGQSHGDHHQIWIDPRDGDHILIGNDGGLDVSYDQGATWEEISNMATGQFYAVSADMRKPYYVCGGLQDNGSWCGPSAVRSNAGILNTDWYRIGGGDGFYTANDPRDYTIGYAESQDGSTNRYDLKTGRSQSIRPRAGLSAEQRQRLADPQVQSGRGGSGRGGHPEGNIVPPVEPGTSFRFFWSTPFVLSPHDPDVLYLGGERLFRSTNRGSTWSASADLTRKIGRNDRPIMGVAGDTPMASKHDGAASYSNITTIGESPMVAGIVWVGTNDGNVQVSRDFGATFTDVTANFAATPVRTTQSVMARVGGGSSAPADVARAQAPARNPLQEMHVSRVSPSHFDAGTAYVSFDGHRTDDHNPYIFKTTNFGATWTSIASNLPMGNVNVVKEDPKNRNLLYAGTEYGFYISLNGGREWKRFMNGLPTVRVDDVMVHPRDNDLILGTHGRSIWIMDDITPLQQLAEPVLAADAHLFDVRSATRWLTDITKSSGLGGAKHFRGQNPQGGTAISYVLKSAPAGDVKITISDMRGEVVREIAGTKAAGLNRVQWNLSPNPPPQPIERGRRGGDRGVGRGGRGGQGAPFLNNQAVDAGTYIVKLTVGGREYMKPVVVEHDVIR